ncbi:MAG: tRNA (adenosine(37)-N6)-dimethylallyltransferase MiaA [Candidatus Dojkabacteria bacterium]
MKVIIVAGPTATGKTELAVKIAKKFNGELINADSRQVYKGLDVGTNKGAITLEDSQYSINEVPIHLINIVEPNERFSVFDFQHNALDKIKEISSRGRDPIIVGGTGLYIDSIVRGYDLSSTNLKEREMLDGFTVSQLQNLISSTTLDQLNNSDRNNPRRLVRIIEKGDITKKSNLELGLNTFILYPMYNWDELKLKIDLRVDEMFNEGLIEETKGLLEKGYSEESDGLKIMGYKQVIEFLNKKIDLNTCKERVKIAHKQYAKRQRTWFEGNGRNYNLNKYSDSSEALRLAENFLINEN